MTPSRYEEIRRLLGWTMADLARAVGKSVPLISRRESGGAMIDMEAELAILALAQRQGVKLPENKVTSRNKSCTDATCC